jgi:RimK family alpha-L-glutamate ligase
MKQGWIIYSKETINNKFNNNAFDWMNQEAKSNGLKTIIVFEEDIKIEISKEGKIEIFINQKNQKIPDFILLRSYCLDISKALEILEIPIFNTTSSLNDCRNKWISHLICAKNNIPQPKTVFIKRNFNDFIDITSSLGLPFVIKEVIGSKGEGVFLINNNEEFERIINTTTYELICQEFIQESSGEDIRVHVIDGKAVVAIKRKAEKGFKSNYSLGGTSTEFKLNKEIIELSVKCAKIIGLDIAGIDILLSDRGPLVCEINGISAFRTVAINTDINIPKLIFKMIKEKITMGNTV